MLVDFREIIHHDNKKIIDFSIYCVVKYKGKKRYFINRTKEDCLLDVIESMIQEEIFVDDLEP
tara:strand:+ start:1069 stop:1257 length:189 start_codon:yes stop_codon:yes gene_type:complete